jgi:NodT family efflux transporter outer membrane factor (OMF) lipoprotein
MSVDAPIGKRPCPTAVLAALLATGCAPVGPNFQRPDAPWLEGWRVELPEPAPTAQPQAAPSERHDEWWRVFEDPALDQVVAAAQRANPSVAIAGARIMEARAQLGVAGSGLYPQLQQVSGHAFGVGQSVSDAPDQTFASYGAAFDIAWEMDFWGKYRRGIEAADANYFASIAQYDDVQVLVAAQAASFYTSIRTFEQRLHITQENAALQKRSLEITERLFSSGNEAELDVQQAKSLYLGTIATIPELESGLRQAQNALNVLLGRPPGPVPEMAAGREQIPEAGLDVIVDLPASLLRRRPDVRSAEMLLAAQSALIGVSQAALYPSIALVGTVGLSATSLSSSSTTLAWSAGPALAWNVFDHGRLQDQVLVQDARFQQLYEAYQDTLLRAARELDDAAVSFAKSRVQADILEQAAQAAKRSLDIATIQYQEGLVDFERVLDSQRTLFSQQERLVTTRSSVSQSLISLYKAMGGGWQAARSRPVLEESVRKAMAERSDWHDLLTAPLPVPAQEYEPPKP